MILDRTPALAAALTAAGARLDGDAVRDFGDPAEEARAAATGSVVVPLASFGVLDFVGDDAAEFLHAQVSCDVKGLAADRSTYGTYNTAKGRMLASFLLWRTAEGFRMLASRSLLPALQKRLQMFVLRAKVRITDRTASDALIGASGADAPAAVARACGPAPSNRHDVSAFDGGYVLRVPGGRFIVAVAPERAADVWTTLAGALRPAGSERWTWLDIVNGIGLVTAPLQDQLVPQMANMELVGAINFKKGCYPGQEIVARTQYLGKLKRRMYLARVVAEPPPAPGDALFSEDVGDQANGVEVAAAAAPDAGYDCRAVVQSGSAEQSQVHLRALDGPVLAFRALPYKVA
jgi:folate-binding protein YgfZ